MVLGGGPNRIGQGIEFDYCCVHAALAMREDGYETIMVNCNPETRLTDYDTSDCLYFEPVTLEDVLEIVALEKPSGVIVQFGGQTLLKLVEALEEAEVPVIGTSADAIDRAEDRERFQAFIRQLGLQQPPNKTVMSEAEGLAAAEGIGYPIVVRPSYVLGGRARRSFTSLLSSSATFDRGGGLGGVAGAAGSLPRPSGGSGRGCGERWQGRGDWRHHGAHRASWGAFRRLRLRPSALPLISRASRRDP